MIADQLFDSLPLWFAVLGGGVAAIQVMTHTSKRIKQIKAKHQGHQGKASAASRAVRERAAATMALRREERVMERELAELNQSIDEGEVVAEREKAAESQIYVFDERKNVGDQAFLLTIAHSDFNALARNAPPEITQSWQQGRRYMVWAANAKMASAKAGMRFNQDKGYRVGAATAFEGDPEEL